MYECDVCTGNKSIYQYLDNFVMVQWCNKYGEMVQIIHTSSHGEMVPRESHISCHYLLNIVSIIVKLAMN